jgi:hypothetical protein
LRWPLLILLLAVAVTYFRIFSAGFVVFDDDFQVYANPFLNPPTLESVARFWEHAYKELYVPLAYTIFAVIARFAEVPAHVDSSIGHTVSLAPTAFHVVSLALHLANAWLCFCLVRRLTGRARAAWLCAFLFVLHPLQLEALVGFPSCEGYKRWLRVAGAEYLRPVAPNGRSSPISRAARCIGALSDVRNALQTECCGSAPGRAGNRSNGLPNAMAQGAHCCGDLGSGRSTFRLDYPRDAGCSRSGSVSLV